MIGPILPSLGPSAFPEHGVLMLSDGLVVALAIFFVVFALAVIWVAFWYHSRQDKQVRTDEDAPEDPMDFTLRPDEQEAEEGGEREKDADKVEPGTSRFRRA